jgi:Carbohydrate-selective porin, OprB family/S-layer homology domain
MKNYCLNLLLATPVLFSAVVFLTESAIAQSVDNSAMEQITSVSELRDVAPTEWAYQALQSLVERYGCIVGYPDQTYRGNRALTRWEFAAGLNACINAIERLIQENVAVFKEDIDTLKRLAEEFEAELTALGGRVDNLEGRVAYLEDHQFSTTTKLTGQVIFALTDAFGGASENGQEDNYNTTFSDRVRLNFVTSFTGKDELLTRIQATNIIDPRPATDTAPGNEARLSFQSGGDTSNDAFLSRLQYTFPINDSIEFTVGTGSNIGFIDVLDDIVNPLASDATATISRFGRYNPIYRLGFDTGAAANIQLGGNFKLELGYLASEASDPTSSNGFFNGDYAAAAQVVYAPDFATIAFTYVNAYNDDGLGHGTGSIASNLDDRAVESNSYGIQANFKIAKGFELGGWVGYMDAEIKTVDRGSADVWNWAVTLAFPDLGKEGNLGGVIVGMPPKLTGTSESLSDLPRQDSDTGLHVEAFYRYAITDNISITPGVVWLTAPNHDNDNDDIFLAVVRTTFSF